MMAVRPYQRDTIDAIRRGWAEFKRQLVVLPTGSGKTCISAWVAQEHVQAGQRVLFLAHREELLLQTIDKFKRAAGLFCELEKAEHHASRTCQVVVGSVQTFMARGYNWDADHFDLVIVDEAHHVMADSYRRVLEMFPGARVLGITATPDRADAKNLGGVFQNIAAEVKLFDLIADGYLAPITLKAIPLQIDLNGVKSIAGDFAADDLGNRLEPLLGNIARGIAEHASFRRVLAFLPLIATSQKFVAACRAEGLHAEHIDGESPDRREKLERFARGEFDLLSNAMLLTEGFDDPGIDCVCVLRPTRSRPLYSQMVGRGTRIHPAKDNLLLLDFLWMHQRHALVRPASLIAHTDEEAEAITELAEEKGKAGGPVEELELEGLASEATAQREQALLKKLAENKNKAARTMTAEEFALQHHSMETAEFEPVMEWERQAVTEKQAWCLKRAKIDLASVRGKGHASKLISLIKGDGGITLATPGQRYAMRKAGHPNWSNATQHEARQFFAGLRRK